MIDQTPSVSVIIPTRNAAPWLSGLLDALHAQTARIAEIVIVDSRSEDDTRKLADDDALCRVMTVDPDAFDHGGTRDLAARTCQSDYLWFLTQDAVPADEHCLAALLTAARDPRVAAAYGRQLATEGSGRIEQLSRQFNYPPHSFVRSAADIPALQVRAFFMSNTCCLYRRDVYLSCGGFRHDLPTNEDMLMASTFLHNGYATAYCAEARVWHAHRMTLRQWYGRSFDTGAFMAMFRSQLNGVTAQGEGGKYAAAVLGALLREGRALSAVRFLLICASRLAGDRAGRGYARLSPKAILRRTQNRAYWSKHCGATDACEMR